MSYPLAFGQAGVLRSIITRADVELGSSDTIWKTVLPLPQQISSLAEARDLAFALAAALEAHHPALVARYSAILSDTPRQTFDQSDPHPIHVDSCEVEDWSKRHSTFVSGLSLDPTKGRMWQLSIYASRDGSVALGLAVSQLIADRWAFYLIQQDIIRLNENQKLPPSWGCHELAIDEANMWSARREKVHRHWARVRELGVTRPTRRVDAAGTWYASEVRATRRLVGRKVGHSLEVVGLAALGRVCTSNGGTFCACLVVNNRVTAKQKRTVTSLVQPGVVVLAQPEIDQSRFLSIYSAHYLRGLANGHFDPFDMDGVLPEGMTETGIGFPATYNVTSGSIDTAPTPALEWKTEVVHEYPNYLRASFGPNSVRATWSSTLTRPRINDWFDTFEELSNISPAGPTGDLL